MKTDFKKQFSELMENISYKYWIILAAAASILLGVLLFVYLDESPAPPPQPQSKESTIVVVAASDIAPRTIIQSNMLTTKEIPTAMVPEGAITDMREVVGKPARFQLIRDDIVTDKKVLMDIKMAGFTGIIPPDCRAISIAINDVTGISGFAKPGDYVDVMVVSNGGNEGRITSNIILQNILLLAVNRTPMNTAKDNMKTSQPSNGDVSSKDSKDKDDKSSDSFKSGQAASTSANKTALATATLAVSPRDAMELIAAVQSGTVYLVLRPYKPRDTFTTTTEYSKVTNKAATQQSPPAPAATQPAPAPTPSAPAAPAYGGSVEVIRGTSLSREGA